MRKTLSTLLLLVDVISELSLKWQGRCRFSSYQRSEVDPMPVTQENGQKPLFLALWIIQKGIFVTFE